MLTICATRDKKSLFSGSSDGVVAKWNISGIKSLNVGVEWYFCDHSSAIVTMDASYELDLIITASIDGAISLRVISTGKFVKLLKPNFELSNKEYTIKQIRLSHRGYILILARDKTELNDYYLVYSINGEKIKVSQANDKISSVLLDESGYKFIAGGKAGSLTIYDLLSLESQSLHPDLEAENGKKLALKDSDNHSITTLAITRKENHQQLFIGMSNGSIFALRNKGYE